MMKISYMSNKLSINTRNKNRIFQISERVKYFCTFYLIYYSNKQCDTENDSNFFG